VIWATSSIVAKFATTIEATYTIATANDLTIAIKTMTPWSLSSWRQGLQEQKVLQEEGWLQMRSLQENEWQGHA
jgi:hypothetical protein